MDDILPALKKLFPILLMVLLMAPSALFSKKRRQQARDKAGKPPAGSAPPVGDSELARRVQKNFEALMRQRTGGEPVIRAEPEPWKPVPAKVERRPPARQSAKPPARQSASQPVRKPRRKPQPGDAPDPKLPTHSDAYLVGRDAYKIGTEVEQGARDAYRVDQASTSGPLQPHRARQLLLGGGTLNRQDLRRAILLKEILGRPVSMGSSRDSIPGA